MNWLTRLFKRNILWESEDALNPEYRSTVVYLTKGEGQLKVYRENNLFAARYVKITNNEENDLMCWEWLSCYIINEAEGRSV